MKNMTHRKMTCSAAALLVLALCISVFSAPALAQRVVVRPGPTYLGHPRYHHYHHHHYRANDFDRAMAIVGTVGAAVAIARQNRYYHQPAVVVAPARPTVVVTPPSPVVVQRPVVIERQVVVEQPVIVERQVPAAAAQDGSFSPKLGAWFRIENMQLPGYRFTAARLMSDPLPDSPLHRIGLRKGDVITRLNDNPADNLAELERHERNTLVRYIKTGTTRVLLANVHIPATTEVYNAP